MNFLVVSGNNCKELLSISLAKDNWHYTKTKLDLVLGRDGFLNRNKYVENIKGVLYLSDQNRKFDYTGKDIEMSKSVCYPSLKKLKELMNKYIFFGNIMKKLKANNEKCVNYPWSFIIPNKRSYSNNNLTFYNFMNSYKDKFIDFVIDKDDYIFTSKDIYNENMFHKRGVFVKKFLGEEENQVCCLFLGTKYFIYKIIDNNYIEYKNVDDDFVNLCKKIKAIAGLTLIKINFMDYNNNLYLFDIEPFPEIPGNDEIKSCYKKYIELKMNNVKKKFEDESCK